MRRVLLALGVLLAPLCLTSTATADTSGAVTGAGSTWAQPVVEGWRQHAQVDGLSVSYAATGNADGKAQFADGTTDFAITEIPYLGTDDLGDPDTGNGRDLTYVPILAASVGLSYHLVVHDTRVTDLRLSPATIAGIFSGAITDWDDPAITADNNGRTLPSLPITPVVHADGAGVSRAFSSWFADRFPTLWQSYAGQAGPTSFFPTPADGIAVAGSAGVTSLVSSASGNGRIAYLEPAYAVQAGLPVAKVENQAGYFVRPTAGNVAVALRQATVGTDHVAALSGVYTATDPRSYPLSSVAYEVVPTGPTDPGMTTAQRQTLLDVTTYALCGGQPGLGSAYGSLPLGLVQEGFTQVRRLGEADPSVDLTDRDAAHCASLTFDSATLTDTLDQSVAMPAICDSQGAGPCGRTGMAGRAGSCAVHGPITACGHLTFTWEGIESGSIRIHDRAGGPDVVVGLKRERLSELRPTPDGLRTVQTDRGSPKPIWDGRTADLTIESLPEQAGCDVWRLTAMVGVRRHGQVHWTPRRLAQGRDPVACH